MAEAIGSDHRNVVLNNVDVAEALVEATLARGVPGFTDVDSSLLLFCRQVHRDFKVCLSGECADEIFGGYPWYHRQEILFADTFPWSRSVDVRQGLLRPGLLPEGADYVLIHDGARPLVSADIIKRSMQAVKEYRACVAGMPVKDTIKIADEDGYAKLTPERSKVWQIQTPQSFSYPLVYEAYRKMLADEDSAITDDAMVVERMTNQPVKLIEGNYRNIKITTPEDMLIAEMYLKQGTSNI